MSAKQPMKAGLKAYLGTACLIVIAIIVARTHASPQETEVKRRKRDAANLCWKEQRLKSLAQNEQRTIASACEAMDAEFVRDYGIKPY